MSNPLVSVVMNCLDCEKYLKQAIDSVYSQTYKDWEIIFWDNASTDSSQDIARSYGEKLKYHRADRTTPLGEARNFALDQCRGKYIAFLDCDDLYMPHKLERQVVLMEKEDYPLSYTSAIVINHQGEEIRKTLVKNESGNIFGKLLSHYEINMQTAMIRRDILEKDNLKFNSSMKYCPDHNLFMTIASKYGVGVIRECLVKYRILAGSLSSQTINIASSEIRLTLDEILDQRADLRQRYERESSQAYDKLYYYDAVADLTHGRRLSAIANISNILFKRMEYFLLYILLHLPVTDRAILKILRR